MMIPTRWILSATLCARHTFAALRIAIVKDTRANQRCTAVRRTAASWFAWRSISFDPPLTASYPKMVVRPAHQCAGSSWNRQVRDGLASDRSRSSGVKSV